MSGGYPYPRQHAPAALPDPGRPPVPPGDPPALERCQTLAEYAEVLSNLGLDEPEDRA